MATTQHPETEPSDSLIDELLESYIYWLEACEDVRTAYQRWQDSKDPGRALEFERYLKSGSGRAFARRHFG